MGGGGGGEIACIVEEEEVLQSGERGGAKGLMRIPTCLLLYLLGGGWNDGLCFNVSACLPLKRLKAAAAVHPGGENGRRKCITFCGHRSLCRRLMKYLKMPLRLVNNHFLINATSPSHSRC